MACQLTTIGLALGELKRNSDTNYKGRQCLLIKYCNSSWNKTPVANFRRRDESWELKGGIDLELRNGLIWVGPCFIVFLTFTGSCKSWFSINLPYSICLQLTTMIFSSRMLLYMGP